MKFQAPIYPVESWSITETDFSEKLNYRNETTFALSNGYLGTRGTFVEGYDFDIDTGLEGNFINGFYESEHVRYGEWNYGFPTMSQSLLNLPDCKRVEIYVDGERFDLRKGKILSYGRSLHMNQGIVTREVEWESESGKAFGEKAGSKLPASTVWNVVSLYLFRNCGKRTVRNAYERWR